ncbi:MAG: hypothetical protein O7F73_11975 [Gammaproteobacteria bacterium]|nr:hypothetical protein [Gammaproteobacteria bacterium]
MSRVTQAYCQRFAISQISFQLEAGVVESADQVCTLDIEFEQNCRVQFKLQGEQARLGERVSKLSADGTVAAAAAADPGVMEDELEALFHSIEGRLTRIQHEEEVQSIVFLGNTFVLNNQTVFDVVADLDGRLTIEMHKGETRQSAMLLASSLLDGLYDGSISLKE